MNMEVESNLTFYYEKDVTHEELHITPISCIDIKTSSTIPGTIDTITKEPIFFILFSQIVDSQHATEHIILSSNSKQFELKQVSQLEDTEASFPNSIPELVFDPNLQGRWIALQPTSPLPASTLFQLVVPSGIKSLENPYKSLAERTISFSTLQRFVVISSSIDYEAPLASTTPHVSIEFSQPILEVPVIHMNLNGKPESLYLQEEVEERGYGKWTLTSNNLRLNYFRTLPWCPSSLYEINLPINSITSQYDYKLEQPHKLDIATPVSYITHLWPYENSTNVSTIPTIVICATQPIYRRNLPSKINIKNEFGVWAEFENVKCKVISDDDVPGNAPYELLENIGMWAAVQITSPLPVNSSIRITVGPGVPSLFGPRESDMEMDTSFTTCDSFKVMTDLIQPYEIIQGSYDPIIIPFNQIIVPIRKGLGLTRSRSMRRMPTSSSSINLKSSYNAVEEEDINEVDFPVWANAIVINPAIAGKWKSSKLVMEAPNKKLYPALVFEPKEPWLQSPEYTICIPSGTSGLGESLDKEFFKKIITHRTRLKLTSTYPSANQVITSGQRFIWLQFNQKVVHSSVAKVIQLYQVGCEEEKRKKITLHLVEPLQFKDIPEDMVSSKENIVCFSLSPSKSLPANHTFLLEIGPNVQSQEGPLVTHEKSCFTFSTDSPFGISHVTDPNLASTDCSLAITFNQPIRTDPDSTWNPQISPDMVGRWARDPDSESNSVLRFTPEWPWKNSTLYSVKISAGVKSGLGDELSEYHYVKCMTTEPEAWATEVDPNTTISIFWNQKVDPKTAHKFVKVQYAVTKYKKVKTTVEVESTENVLVLRPEKPLPFSALITVVIKPTPAIEGPLMPNLLYSFIFNTRKAKCTMEDPIHKSLTERKHTF